MNLHERIAKVLGWTETECRTFSLVALRDLVQPVDSTLAQEISSVVQGGWHISQKGQK